MSQASDAFVGAAQDFTEAMRATASDPADAVRILAAFVAAPVPTFSQPDQAAAAEATAAVFRRAALGSIALACADLAPSNSTDAQAVIAQVAGLLDAEMLAAADAGQTASYAGLRDLRSAVIADLTARTAALPDLVTVRIPGALPSLALAYRLYGDATREPGMVARANVVHPGFMPAAFEALSS